VPGARWLFGGAINDVSNWIGWRHRDSDLHQSAPRLVLRRISVNSASSISHRERRFDDHRIVIDGTLSDQVAAGSLDIPASAAAARRWLQHWNDPSCPKTV
jgi:hypothetical protein